LHPIERLRYVARADGAGVTHLVDAAAHALTGLTDDEASLVTGCRQMVDRHPTVGPLWTLASRMLCSTEPSREAWRFIEAIENDPSPRVLAGELPQDAVVLVFGWPELVAGTLHHRGDLRVRVVDAYDLVLSLQDVGVDAVEVPSSGVGAAAADADVVVLEALAAGPTGLVAASGGHAAAAVAHHAGRQVWAVVGEGRLLPGPLWAALLDRLPGGPAWDAEEEVVPSDLIDRVIGSSTTDCPVAAELFKGVYAPGTFTAADRPSDGPADRPADRPASRARRRRR
jgi:hypothetical protein